MTSQSSVPPDVVALDDYERHARARLCEQTWAYVASGGADGLTLRWNREAFDAIRLEGRVLADMRGADTSLTFLGERLDFPILLAPVAFQKLVHPEGERASTLGASAAGAWLTVSTQASVTLEEIAQAATRPLMFQLYLQSDRGLTLELVRRAEAAGCRALVVTADASVNGVRNAEQRAGFRLPEGVSAVNLRPSHGPTSRAGPGESPVFKGLLDGAPTWDDIAWLRGETKLPILLKGIMSPDDALRAADLGADGVIVSNHGGRTLDTLPATIEALPRIAERLEGRVPILLDGGIRRGTDVLKALALGADAVMIGRPYLYALAVAGAVGVIHALAILRTELEVAMALTGRARLADIDRSVIWRP